MKRFFKIFIPLVILGAVAYQFRGIFNEGVLPVWETVRTKIFMQAPCSEPIPYTLGNFAPEFKISEKYFLGALTEAEAIWEKPSQKDLFAYAPKNESKNSSYSVLKINLIYDFRQQATSKLKSLGITVDENKTSYDALKVKFTSMKAEYEKDETAFSARVDAFNKEKKVYEEEVEYWNKQGGAPKGEYEKLQAASLALKEEAGQLNRMQADLNEQVEGLNAMVVVLNRLAGALNLSVEKYNTINDARGETFEEGVYYSEGLKREIDIYEFSSREKLVRVLAHELGHALGIGHVEDPKAIMYELNQGNSLSLTKADIAALEVECQE